MGVLLTSGDSYSRTTALPTFPCTMMCWAKLVSDNGAINNALAFGDTTGSAYVQLGADMTGGTNAFFVWNGATSATGLAAAINTWYHLCLIVRNPAGAGAADDAQGYINAANNINVTNTGDNVSAEKLWVGNDPDSEFWNGHIAAAKIWSGVELTVAEIQQEMLQILPVRTANLYGFWPLFSTSDDEIDFSGNGNNWTVGGTLANGDSPPIPWFAGRKSRIYLPGGSWITIDTIPLNIDSSLVAPLLIKERLESPVSLAGGLVAPTLQIERQEVVVAINGSIVPITVLKERLETPLELNITIVSPSIGQPIVIDTATVELILSGVAPSLQIEANQTTLNLTISNVVPTLQIETNQTPVSITSSAVTPTAQLAVNQTPLIIVIDIVSPAIGETIIISADVLNLTLSFTTPLLEKIYSQTPLDITSSIVANTLQIQLSTTPVSITSSVVSLTQQLEINVGVVTLTTTILGTFLEHQVNINVLDLVFSVVDVTTSHTVEGGEITIVVSPEPLEAKNNLFAAFFDRLKFINKQNIVSEFVLEETPLPYLSLGQTFNVLSWKNSCLERFEESNFRLSVYAENYDELQEKVNELQQHLVYNTILLASPKQVISLDQVAKITQELIPQLFRTQLIYEIIVQKHISEVYIGSPTSGETLNKAIYERFKSLPLASMVNDLVSPGHTLENTDYPYLVVPVIRENLAWNHSLGRIDNIKYPLTVYSEDLIQLTDLMDEIEKSYDYCRFIIDGKEHLINEWVGTDIVELQPQLWRGSVNYEILVESSLASFKV